MNEFEFAEEFRLSLAKTRAIKKRFPQIFSNDSSPADAIRATIANGDNLTVRQLVELIDNPRWLLSLGKYAAAAEREIAKLGNPQSQAAPKEVIANVMEAAKGEPEAVQILVDWLKSIIPDKPVEHAYIATRLLLGVQENIRKYEGPRIPRALLNCRNHPEFASWWSVEKGTSRNKTVYRKNLFDL